MPNDVSRLEEGKMVVLLVDKSSYGFTSNIYQFLDDATLSILHTRTGGIFWNGNQGFWYPNKKTNGAN